MHHPLRIGVLRGGPSPEYEVSLSSGASVIQSLRDHFPTQYHPHDIFIDRCGKWHIDGVAIKPHDLHTRIDLAFNALHGHYGEDGKVQAILESHHIPFTGSGSFSSAIGMNKVLSKKIFADHNIKSPLWREVEVSHLKANRNKVMKELFESFVLPVVVKPSTAGSSVGVSIVRAFPDLSSAIEAAAEHSHSVMLEQYIPGIEATCGVIEGFRGQELYALPPVEIRPVTDFFDYDAKYKGQSQEIVPATFSHKIKKAIEELAIKIHRAFGLRHYSRSDFIIHPRWGIYTLEVNTLPGLTNESLMPKALRAVGSDLPEFLAHVIERARV